MDNSYRFGKLEVSCEGYNYPEDPYILRGSCGVRNIHSSYFVYLNNKVVHVYS